MLQNPEGRWGHPHQHCRAQGAILTETGGDPLRCQLIETGGGLSLTVLWDRCMDVAHLSYRGVSIPFLAPAGLGGRQADGFGQSFSGGMLYTCGLSNVGPASQGEPLHGRIHFAQAQNAGIHVDEEEIRLEGQMFQSALFGHKLLLERRWIFPIGESRMRLCDRIVNQGAAPAPLMLLYHINLGHPFLSEELHLEFPPGSKTYPACPAAASALEDIAHFTAPMPDAPEQDFHHRLPEQEGFAEIRAVNSRLGIGLALRYTTAELPWLVEWRYLRQGEYVLGLEPANNRVNGLEQAAADGTVRMLAPGESCQTEIELCFFSCSSHLHKEDKP